MFKNTYDSTKKDFIKYLDSLNLSPKSHKNYRSDLSHFLSWAILKVRSMGSYIDTLTELVPFLGSHIGQEYKNFMIHNKLPVATINRRLSTLRHVSKFLLDVRLIEEDFAKDIDNITKENKVLIKPNNLLGEFQAHLEARKVSKNTIKNYVSDTRQFLAWLNEVKQKTAIN